MELTSDHDSLRATCDALKSDKHRTEEQVQCCVACLGFIWARGRSHTLHHAAMCPV